MLREHIVKESRSMSSFGSIVFRCCVAALTLAMILVVSAWAQDAGSPVRVAAFPEMLSQGCVCKKVIATSNLWREQSRGKPQERARFYSGEEVEMAEVEAGAKIRNAPKARSIKQRSKAARSRLSAPRPAITIDERRAQGKALRDRVPRDAHAAWQVHPNRANPIAILRAADVNRQPELVPLRYGRMLQSPFTFYRGSAGVMASDLANTPATGIRVQACGDCHLMNFGGFATPERRLIFDINDLDETLPAPWEWDVKRLVSSFVLAARSNGLSDEEGCDAAIAAARSYRKHMRAFASMDVLDIWYARLDDQDFMAMIPRNWKVFVEKRIAKATALGSHELVYPKLVEETGKEPQIHDSPPTIFHEKRSRAAGYMDMLRAVLASYRETLPEDRRVLLDRYRFVDAAVKVVGIGSVGTLCGVILMMSIAGHPFFLQAKEANASVLEAFAGKSAYPHHGQRVVMGQRLVQPASDMFLGWATGPEGRQFYFRQLRDVKLNPLVETFDAEMLSIYAKACGWVLARAHAKAGDPWSISGYLGKQEDFDEAMGKFALAYADQAERDHATLKSAVRAGRVEVQLER
jgi:uncharacterized protein (DUF2252 family)